MNRQRASVFRGAGLGLALVLGGRGLLAQAPEASVSPADEAFAAGRAALKAGQIDEACAHFATSHALEPSAGALVNLGLCEQQRQHHRAARRVLADALARLPVEDPRHQIARRALAHSEQSVVRLTILVGAAKCRIRVGEELAVAGRPIELDPGRHHVEAVCAGGVSTTVEVELAPGAQVTRELDFEPTMESSTPGPRVAHLEGRGTERFGWGLVGAGAGATLVAAIATGLMIGRGRAVKRQCGDVTCDDATGVADAAAGRAYSDLATASLIVGGSFATVGGVLLLDRSARARRAARREGRDRGE